MGKKYYHQKLEDSSQFNIKFQNFRFVPSEVDQWFRQLIKDLKEERVNNPPPHEDLFQMILNNAHKHGKYPKFNVENFIRQFKFN